jgi:hypothetical protein
VFVLLLTTGLTAGMPPVEYVVDCTSCPGEGKFALVALFEDRDGRQHRAELILERVTPPALVLTLTSGFDDCGWRYELIDNRILVIRGSRTTPVRSVKFVSQVWTPVVYPRFATRPFRELGPPPRAIKQ